MLRYNDNIKAYLYLRTEPACYASFGSSRTPG